MKKKRFLPCIGVSCVLSLLCSCIVHDVGFETDAEKIDDWELDITPESNKQVVAEQGLPRAAIGFSVGGAKDADNFYENIVNGYLPKVSSVTYEGLFYDYFFDTGSSRECEELFCPSYSKAVTRDLYSGQTDYYLTVGLNSGLTGESVKRKKLNLVVVLDISDSMGAKFDKYYYDQATENLAEAEQKKNKMEIAADSIVEMMQHLKGDDRFGVILFDHAAYKAKPLRLVKNTKMEAIAEHILAIKERGGTNWQAGYREGILLFDGLKKKLRDPEEYENRIIFLTDAMPNTGELSKAGLFGMVDSAAAEKIHTSFIGVGVDFNTDLVEQVSKTRGANYYSVHSAKEFKKRLDEQFDFMVTPLVFDLELKVQSTGYEIAGVFGSPEAGSATGEIMKINTLFPSKMEEGRIRGGVVLVKLRRKENLTGPGLIELSVSYEDRNGKGYTLTDQVRFDSDDVGFENKGIHKAILLTEYVSLVRNWLLDERKGCNDRVAAEAPVYDFLRHGIQDVRRRPEFEQLETWERRSCVVGVSEGYRNFFTMFKKHFQEEMDVIGDETLAKEMNILATLVAGRTSAAGKGVIDDWQLKRPQ